MSFSKKGDVNWVLISIAMAVAVLLLTTPLYGKIKNLGNDAPKPIYTTCTGLAKGTCMDGTTCKDGLEEAFGAVCAKGQVCCVTPKINQEQVATTPGPLTPQAAQSLPRPQVCALKGGQCADASACSGATAVIDRTVACSTTQVCCIQGSKTSQTEVDANLGSGFSCGMNPQNKCAYKSCDQRHFTSAQDPACAPGLTCQYTAATDGGTCPAEYQCCTLSVVDPYDSIRKQAVESKVIPKSCEEPFDRYHCIVESGWGSTLLNGIQCPSDTFTSQSDYDLYPTHDASYDPPASCPIGATCTFREREDISCSKTTAECCEVIVTK